MHRCIDQRFGDIVLGLMLVDRGVVALLRGLFGGRSGVENLAAQLGSQLPSTWSKLLERLSSVYKNKKNIIKRKHT